MHKKVGILTALIIIAASSGYFFLVYKTKSIVYSKYAVCFADQSVNKFKAILDLAEKDYQAYCQTGATYYQEWVSLKNKLLPNYYKLENNATENRTPEALYQSSLEQAQSVDSALKLYEQNKVACKQSKEFNDCVCSNKVTALDFVGFLDKSEKLKQTLAPAYSKGQLNSFAADSEKFGAYVVIDSLGYTNLTEFKNDVDKLTEDTSIPQLIGVDGEGGVVQRFSWRKLDNLRTLSQKFPDKKALCKQISADAAFLKGVGFNWTLSPVVDVTKDKSFWIYSRTPSDDYQQAQELADLYTKCMQEEDVYVTLKHFPGHGAAGEDSHYIVPVVQKSKQEWLHEDAVAFRNYKNSPAAIMMSHLLFPKIDLQVASQSEIWMQKTLREEIGYQGLIVTDDLNMLRPKNIDECTALVSTAINNGADLALFVDSAMCDEYQILEKLDDGNLIDRTTLKERVTRVIEFKKDQLCN